MWTDGARRFSLGLLHYDEEESFACQCCNSMGISYQLPIYDMVCGAMLYLVKYNTWIAL